LWQIYRAAHPTTSRRSRQRKRNHRNNRSSSNRSSTRTNHISSIGNIVVRHAAGAGDRLKAAGTAAAEAK
jgi:hypothetical protein